ncbi:MAG: ABC transporter permease subunit [Bryobacteraceae bacterium]
MSVAPIVRAAARFAATLLLAGVAGAVLVCLAPGTGLDEQALDQRLSAESLAALAAERAAERDPVRFVPRYLWGLARGDLGKSQAFNQPVASLIGERWPVTVRAMALGLGAAWMAGFALALGAASGRLAPVKILSHGAAGVIVASPAALLALLLAAERMPAWIGIGIVAFPKIYTSSEAVLREAFARPWVSAARARGAGGLRVLAAHVVLPSAKPLAALAAVSVPLALGSSVPLEALGGHPGLGQLAWRATLARDVNLLVGMTLMIAAVTLISNMISGTVEEAR